MDLDEVRQGSMRPSRAWLGMVLVIVLLVAAGALFLVWRPETYTQTVAALTDKNSDSSEPSAQAGATPMVTPAMTEPAQVATIIPTPRRSAATRAPTARQTASQASAARVEQQQGGIEQRLAEAEAALARFEKDAARGGALNTTIKPARYALAVLLDLRPVTFRYTQAFADGATPTQYGLIAEEVDEIYPDVVVYNAAGLPETVQYRKVNAMLLNEVQRQHRQIAAQQEQIDALLTRLAVVERRLDTN